MASIVQAGKITVRNATQEPLYVGVYEVYKGKEPKLFGQVYKIDADSSTDAVIRPDWDTKTRIKSGNERNLYFSKNKSDLSNESPRNTTDFVNVGEGAFSNINKFVIYQADESGEPEYLSHKLKGDELTKSLEKKISKAQEGYYRDTRS